jgi:hypothetical protein
MKLHPNRKYFIDENYFEFINSEEKAYWLGWIASDGHLSKKGTVYRGCGIKEFATEHGLNNSRLCDILNGKRKSHKGFSLLESKG